MVPPVAPVTILNDENTHESVEKRKRNFVPMQGSVRGWNVYTEAGFWLVMPDLPQQLKTNSSKHKLQTWISRSARTGSCMQWIHLPLFLNIHCSPVLQFSDHTKMQLSKANPRDGASNKPQCPTWQVLHCTASLTFSFSSMTTEALQNEVPFQ